MHPSGLMTSTPLQGLLDWVFSFYKHRCRTAVSIYVKARITTIQSVLVAEAAAISLAAKTISLLNITAANYICDNKLLVNMLSSQSPSGLQDWTLKPLLIEFKSNNREVQHQVYKIHRSQNITSHSLPYQARTFYSNFPLFVCSNLDHRLSCPVIQSQQSVHWANVILLHVRCS